MTAFKAYPSLLRANWALAVEYRAQALLWFVSGTFPIIMMSVWMNIAHGRSLNGYSDNDFVSYFLAVAWIRRITYIWVIGDIEKAIQTGELSAFLTRPLDYAHHAFTKILALRSYSGLVVGFIIGILALALPGQQFDLHPFNLLCFALSLVVAFMFEFLAQLIFGTLAFWTTQCIRMHDAWWFFKTLLGGFVLPMALLPSRVRDIAQWLPFQSSIALPAEILIGRASIERIVFGLAVSLAWIVLMYVLSRVLWRAGLRSYGAVGA